MTDRHRPDRQSVSRQTQQYAAGHSNTAHSYIEFAISSLLMTPLLTVFTATDGWPG